MDDRQAAIARAILAGLTAGAAYLGAQMLFATLVHGESAFAPLERMAAILLGPNAAPPQSEADFTIVTMGLLIHFTLAGFYGRIVGALVQRLDAGMAIGTGAVFGALAMYLPNYFVLAPSAFPWFTDARYATALIDHVLFGALAAAIVVALRERARRLARA